VKDETRQAEGQVVTWPERSDGGEARSADERAVLAVQVFDRDVPAIGCTEALV
jgi:hypothetical protein